MMENYTQQMYPINLKHWRMKCTYEYGKTSLTMEIEKWS